MASAIRAKIIFQEECRRKLGWDKEIKEESKAAWQRWLDDLPHISETKIPRYYKRAVLSNTTMVQLHHFCDASEQAYGAATYVRITDQDWYHCVSFVSRSAKLAS